MSLHCEAQGNVFLSRCVLQRNSSVIIEISSGNLHDLQVAHQRIHPGSYASLVDDHCPTEDTFERVYNLEDKKRMQLSCLEQRCPESGHFFALNVAGSQLCFNGSHKNISSPFLLSLKLHFNERFQFHKHQI